MVFYRKYRPQTIEELDSKDVRDLLYSVLSAKDIAHAFLFTGPKGLGKTSAARIVAKAVNCEKNSKLKTQSSKPHLKAKNFGDIEPCNKCHQCISITNGTNIDVLEIDGASNRGIDEIRDLREKIRLSPASAEKKVYIIDEVHMLTTEAFNALLKTLEEPPNHVIFILCTTEPHKVPATILSRCFHIAFKKAEAEELVRSFKRIADKEKLNIAEEALVLIANLSDGSFRDGAKILEEITLLSDGKKISKETIEQKYQIRQMSDQISKMIEFLSKKNTGEALKLISKLTEQGVDMKYFIEQMINVLHSFLLYKVGVEGKEEFTIYNLQFTIEDIKELVELLVKAHADLKYAVLPQLPLEMAVVEWATVDARGPAASFPPASAPSISSKMRAVGSPSSRVTPRSENFAGSPRQQHTSEMDTFWQELIKRVKSQNHSIAGVLRGCGIKSYNNESLVIETGFKFHKERLDDEKTRVIIEKVSREIAGKSIEISVTLK